MNTENIIFNLVSAPICLRDTSYTSTSHHYTWELNKSLAFRQLYLGGQLRFCTWDMGCPAAVQLVSSPLAPLFLLFSTISKPSLIKSMANTHATTDSHFIHYIF